MAKDSIIKRMRLQKGLSQNGLARLAGLDRATVYAAERGRSVSDLTISKISNALEVSADEIDERPETADE